MAYSEHSNLPRLNETEMERLLREAMGKNKAKQDDDLGEPILISIFPPVFWFGD